MGDRLLQRLTMLRRTVRLRLVAYGLCVVAAGGVAAFLAIVTVDWLLSLPAVLRITVAGIFAAGFIMATLHWIVKPLQASLTLGELASHLEARWVSLEDRLVSAVNFMEHGGTGSARMMERVVRGAEKVLDNVSLTTALTTRPLLVRAAIMIASFAVLAMLASQSPDWVRTGAYRYIYPWGQIEWPRTVAIRPLTGDRVVAIGASVTVRMKVERGLDATLRGILRFRDAGGTSGAITMQQDSDNTGNQAGLFHATIDAVTTDLTYWFEAGDDSTSDHPASIRAVRRPEVVEGFLTIDPPSYASDRPSRVLELIPGSVNAPRGGRVRVALRTSKPIPTGSDTNAAALRMSGGDEQSPGFRGLIPLRSDAENPLLLTTGFDVSNDVTFSIELRDEHGIENHRGDDYTILAVPDRPPTITVRRPGAVTEVTPKATLEIQVSAEDDFGIAALEWKIERIDSDAVETRTLTGAAPVESGIDRVRITAGDTWDLATMALTDGDVLVGTATAYDNRPDTEGGGQRSSAVPVRVRIISEAELEVRLKSETATLESRIRRLALDQAELLDDTREQRRHAESRERMDDGGPGDRQAIVGLAAKQVRIARRTRDVADRFGSLRQRIERNGIDDRDAVERFVQLTNSLKQVSNGPMASASRSLTEVRHQRELEPFRQLLQDAEVSEQSALDRLRLALAALSQWGGFHELLTQTRDLAGRQEEIRTRTASVGKSLIGRPVASLTLAETDRLQRLGREQNQLANDIQQLMARMAQVAATNNEQESSQRQSVEAAMRVGRAREVSKQSRSAAENVKSNRTAAAAMAQRSTADALRKMGAALQKHDGRRLDELRKKLERAQDQIAWLITEQEDLQAATNEAEQMTDADVLTAALAPRQRSLKRNTRFLGDDLAEVPQGVAVADIVRRASTPMGDAESYLRRSQGEPAVDAQGEALVLLREAVDRLDAAAQDSAREALRRSLDQIREDLEQIAAQQKQVNAGIAELVDAIAQRGRLGRTEARLASKLARRQHDVQRLLAEQAHDFRVVVVYQWALERIAGWMDQSRARLSGRTIDDRLVRRTERIVTELRKLIQAIVDTQALPVDTQFVESSEGGRGAGGRSAQSRPVPSVAELLVLKAMQSDVNLRTIELHDLMDPDDASESQLRDLQTLAEDQTEISRLALLLTETARQP